MAFEVENNVLTTDEVVEKAKELARDHGYGKFIIVIDGEEYYDLPDLPEEVSANVNISVKPFTKAGFEV